MGWVRATNIGKIYRSYPLPSRRLWDWLTLGHARAGREHQALRGVTIEVRPGEALALVGPNGAGKSTLLSVLRGTVRPDRGRVEIEGRMAALDLGLGFDASLSGYQNLLSGGALMGYSRAEVDSFVPEILEFAEIDDILDEPIRTYSSGMQLRLAFSLATVRRPDVLLIDEALAVGDGYFQQKCMYRIRQFRSEGSTILLVSHDPGAVLSLCNRAAVLVNGVIARQGEVREILEYYNAWLARRAEQKEIEQGPGIRGGRGTTRSGDRSAEIERMRVVGEHGCQQQFVVGERMTLVLEASASRALEDLTIGISIRDRLGHEVFGTNTHLLDVAAQTFGPGEYLVARFEFLANLGPGAYHITAALHAGRTHVQGSYDWWDNVCAFEIVSSGAPTFQGTAWLPVTATIERVAPGVRERERHPGRKKGSA